LGNQTVGHVTESSKLGAEPTSTDVLEEVNIIPELVAA